MGNYGWLLSSAPTYSDARGVWYTFSGHIVKNNADNTTAVRPSVYLIPGVQMKGSGTTSDPYVFAE
jgi:hypothetical protein